MSLRIRPPAKTVSDLPPRPWPRTHGTSARLRRGLIKLWARDVVCRAR
jgi:hypothetical protein